MPTRKVVVLVAADAAATLESVVAEAMLVAFFAAAELRAGCLKSATAMAP